MAARTGDMPEAERALILKGFEAVPALLEQRESKRFTNHIMQGFNNFPSYPMTADLVVNAYLQRLANDEFGSNWLDRQKGYTAENQAVLAWWEAASKMGERAYVAKYAIVRKKKNEASLSTELLLIAQVRYPDLLPEIYLKAIKTKTHSWPVAEALDNAEIPVERKLELYGIAIAGNREEHRNTALRFLQAERADLTDTQLIRLLEKAPKTAADKYWTDQDAGLGWMVSKSNNEQVWDALHDFIDRADLGMQMEIVANLKPAKNAPPAILLSYHKIYDRFQDDERIRDNSSSEKFSGPGAGFPHDKISMRDFVSSHWAHWLGMKLKSPGKGATTKQWEAYRKAVSEKLREAREAKD